MSPLASSSPSIVVLTGSLSCCDWSPIVIVMVVIASTLLVACGRSWHRLSSSCGSLRGVVLRSRHCRLCRQSYSSLGGAPEDWAEGHPCCCSKDVSVWRREVGGGPLILGAFTAGGDTPDKMFCFLSFLLSTAPWTCLLSEAAFKFLAILPSSHAISVSLLLCFSVISSGGIRNLSCCNCLIL